MIFESIILMVFAVLAAWSMFENSNLRKENEQLLNRCNALDEEIERVSRRTVARHRERVAASVKGWRTRKQRKAQEVQHVAG